MTVNIYQFFMTLSTFCESRMKAEESSLHSLVQFEGSGTLLQKTFSTYAIN